MTNSNIKVTGSGRGWCSGTAELDGQSLSWEAYRKNESSVRVMIANNGRWVSPNKLGSVRLAIEPTARGAMQ